MSEYQYYEFHAIDRPLDEKQMRKLRSVSTRGRITPTSFVNDYSWGDFKGNEDRWMEEYFDAFLYVANWGTHVLKLRLPEELLDPKKARRYCPGGSVIVWEKKGKTIVSFVSEDEEGDGWVEGEGELASLIPLRSELARGDLRALYLGWLLCVQNEEVDEDVIEPPVPPNLGALSASLESLVEFLRIDEDLLAVAAQASEVSAEVPFDRHGIEDWVHGLPASEKEAIVVRLMVDGDGQLQNELLARYRRDKIEDREVASCEPERRTVAALLDAAKEHEALRRKRAAAKAAREKARRKRKVAEAREKHLASLEGKERTLWDEVDELIGTRMPKGYDRAVKRLKDLRDLAARASDDRGFLRRLEALKAKHGRKGTLMERLFKVGM